jgi:hypothetical protein
MIQIMDDIFEYIEELNSNMEKEIKKEKIKNIEICYYCKNNIDELCHSFDIYIDNKQIYICVNCEENLKLFTYCHNCENDIEPYGEIYMCSKCPEKINILCCNCSRLHDILVKIKH